MTQQQTKTEKQTLREELMLYRFYVGDAELRAEINSWIAEAQQQNAGTLQEFIRGGLLDMRSEHAMRFKPEHNHPEEGFPEECSGCEHVGTRCPIVSSRDVRTRRKRELQGADSEREARQIWEDIGVRHGCNRIQGWLTEWNEDYAGFISRGHQLLEQVESLTIDAEGDREQLPEELKETVRQGEESGDLLALGGGAGE